MATWKKVIVSGSAVSQLNNDLDYARQLVDGQVLSGSFTGSFVGDGSLLTGVSASLNESLTLGDGLNGGSFDGNTAVTATVNLDGTTLKVGAAGVAVNELGVDTAQLAADAVDGTKIADLAVDTEHLAASAVETAKINDLAVTDAKLAADSVTLGKIADSAFSVTVSGDAAGTANLTSDDVAVSISLADGSVDAAEIVDGAVTFAKLNGAAVVTEAEGIANNDNDTSLPTSAAVKDYVDNNVTAQDLDIAGDSGTGAVDLDSQSLTVAGGSGLTSAASGQVITLDISASGVTNAMLQGSIANAKLVNDSVTLGSTEVDLGATATSVAGLTLTGAVGSGSFSGSFQGNGSLLTDVVGTIENALTDGNGIADFTYDGSSAVSIAAEVSGSTLVVGASGLAVNAGGVTAVELASDSVITSKILDANVTNAKLANSVIEVTDGSNATDIALGQSITFAGTANEATVVEGAGTITVGLPDDVTITQDLTVSRNLVVQGTASFQHTEDLAIADRFILLASGSTSAGDGGIVVQQTGQDVGEVFAFDAATERWAIADAFNASQNVFTPDAFMANVSTGNASSNTAINALVDDRYESKGNLFVGDDEGIWIYS
jgi:hypothetical protein